MLKLCQSQLNKLVFQCRMSYHILQSEITLTNGCIQEIKRKQQNAKFQGQFLRLGVDGGQGCSGFKYQFAFDNQLNEDDFVMKDNDNVLIAVDEITLKYVSGSVVDYEDKMIRAAFYVQDNPNAEKSCSCKISFSPKEGLL